ncbi:MAG: hypothetical protein Q4D06_00850 [Coriobacteriia bacterium]|nr:hypothetical protein [Coriobacteriia bacterium]
MPIQLFRRSFLPGPGGAEGPRTDFTLFVGTVPCFYHNRGGSIADERSAAFCPSDADQALGTVEDQIVQAMATIKDHVDFPLESVTVFSACPSAFMGLDFDRVKADMRDQLGLLCLHQQRCRILQQGPGSIPRGPGRPGPDRGNQDAQPFQQLLELAPDAPVPGTRSLLVLGGSAAFAPENELVLAAKAWGFTQVLGLGNITSPSTLAAARSCGLILATDESFAPLAQKLAGEWGADHLVMPVSYKLDQVDACYDDLQSAYGRLSGLESYRAQAEEALEELRWTLGESAVEISDAERIAADLRWQGLDVRHAEPENPWGRRPFGGPGGPGGPGPRGPQGPGPGGPGNPGASGPGKRRPRPFRSGDPHFPTAGGPPQMNAKGPGGKPAPRPPFMQPSTLPREGERWGYCAIFDLATRLAQEVRK